MVQKDDIVQKDDGVQKDDWVQKDDMVQKELVQNKDIVKKDDWVQNQLVQNQVVQNQVVQNEIPQTPQTQSQTQSPESILPLIYLPISSDDEDYILHSEDDIDLNYQSDDETNYCFKINESIPKSNVLNIHDLNIELHSLDPDTIFCPRCKVCLNNFNHKSVQLHIESCLNFQQQSEALQHQKPILGKLPPKLIKSNSSSYQNKDASTSPKKRRIQKKKLRPNTRTIPIPPEKILTFPITRGRYYFTSMDAFNFDLHPHIDSYFLSHFHSDHYGGVGKNWCYQRRFQCDDDFDDLSLYKPLIYCTKVTANLLTLKFDIDPRFIFWFDLDIRYIFHLYKDDDDVAIEPSSGNSPGLYVTLMTANHCPGSAIFLFESIDLDGNIQNVLHCGDFRANKAMLQHPSIFPFTTNKTLDKIYLDTTYLATQLNFPQQDKICEQTAEMFYQLSYNEPVLNHWFEPVTQSRITDFMNNSVPVKTKKKFLILVGTYVIGKEKLAISILKRLHNCPIYILNIKSRDNQYDIVRTFEDSYLNHVITENELGNETCDHVVHLVPMEIVYKRTDLSNYFYHNKYFDHFDRCIGIRPTGWSYDETSSGPVSRFHSLQTGKPNKETELAFLHEICDICLQNEDYNYSKDILPQNKKTTRTSNKEQNIVRVYSVPYSEHSSYRELALFCLLLHTKHIIPTVNLDLSSRIAIMNRHLDYWNKLKQMKSGNGNNDLMKKIQQINIDIF